MIYISGVTLGINENVSFEATVEYYGTTLYKRNVVYTATLSWEEYGTNVLVTKQAEGVGETASEALDKAIAAFKEIRKDHPFFSDENTTAN